MKNPTTTNHCLCSPSIGESDSATEDRKDQGRFCWLVGVSNLHTCGVAGGDNAGDDNDDDDDDAQKGRREAGFLPFPVNRVRVFGRRRAAHATMLSIGCRPRRNEKPVLKTSFSRLPFHSIVTFICYSLHHRSAARNDLRDRKRVGNSSLVQLVFL